MKSFLLQGDTLTLTAPAGGVTSGVPVLIGAGIFGVPVTDAVAGDSFALKTSGVYADASKAAGAAWAEGDYLYWDNTAKNFTKTSASNTRVGVATRAALSADTTGDVKIGPVVG
jgi:predicted RecA/RadA family phage recombinase